MSSVALIDSLPRFITQEEHKDITGSTPASFSDIPPVLHYKEETASARFEPDVEGFTSEDGKRGTLYVIESALVFFSATGRGFQIPYPSITLHAVARAEQGPYIYCQLDESVAENAEPSGDDEQEVMGMRELSIAAPSTSSVLHPDPPPYVLMPICLVEAIFEAISYCASLHPDPNIDEDDLNDDAFIDGSEFETFAGAEGEELSEVGRAALEHLESIIYDPQKQLANGDEGVEEGHSKDGDEALATAEQKIA
ncbi:regulator of volume decrease after cellular swelling-domain-containing protein [Vararia minispora EC-137]|uniref:Regulator of volume decrease after cellular swelling-domain-containing protein n=1 Tax=Vararia minispora EC-137 TaxID=1314806 RepID=A0ACB8QNN7_9AGAM|nr:regulator of volume decrease after cellular swelling-domain-containing protein [Vararia minispora EC-137]